MFAITADQRRSRTTSDHVPVALKALPSFGMTLGFERTAGDEIQGLTDDPRTVVEAVSALSRLRDWRVGVGIGSVETPLPESTRAARGTAYLAARAAIEVGAPVVVRAGSEVASQTMAERAETSLLALNALLTQRSDQGWQVVDLIEQGHTQTEIAAQLGISASAVSQRLSRADHQLSHRLAALSTWLLDQTRTP